MWPDELNYILDSAEEVSLSVPAAEHDGVVSEATQRQALRLRVKEDDYEHLWPLAETRYRLDGRFAGKAITLIVNNPHYHGWHPADGGIVENTSDSGKRYATNYVVVHFLLDDVREAIPA
jgi:hypothetical protein